MNLSERTQLENDGLNVVSLFGRTIEQEMVLNDPLADLIQESEIMDIEEGLDLAPTKARKVVSENQFPDQSIYVLEEQLSSLRSSLNRIKFYLGDLDDLLPR